MDALNQTMKEALGAAIQMSFDQAAVVDEAAQTIIFAIDRLTAVHMADFLLRAEQAGKTPEQAGALLMLADDLMNGGRG